MALRKGELGLIFLETAAAGVGSVCGLVFKAGVCKLLGAADEEELAEKIETMDQQKKAKAIADKKSKEKEKCPLKGH